MSPLTEQASDLHLLAYPIDPQRLGSVTTYSLDTEFARAWQNLTDYVRRERHDGDVQPTYSHLAAALSAVTGQPVSMLRQGRDEEAPFLLVTTRPIDPWILETAFATFESRTRPDAPVTLGPLVRSALCEQRRPADFIRIDANGAISAPGWLRTVARWRLADQIATSGLIADAQAIALRPDTEGNLLAWDQPIERTNKRTGKVATATVYLETSIRTFPGASHLYFCVQPRVARVPNRWNGVTHAWVARDLRGPIVRLPAVGPWVEKGRAHALYPGHIAAIIEACHMSRLPQLPNEAETADTSRVRLRGKPWFHDIGKGVGVRFAFQIQEQIGGLLDAPSPTFTATKLRVGVAQQGPIARDELDRALLGAQAEQMRIVGLYDSALTRDRMRELLERYAPVGSAINVTDDVEFPLTNRASAVLHRFSGLIDHTAKMNALDEITALRSEAGTRVAALVETAVPTKEQRKYDTKPKLRTELGARGIVSQFLDPASADSGTKRKDTNAERTDHAGLAALSDLLRAAGVIDDRLETSLTAHRANIPLAAAATFVGIHLRINTPRWGARDKPSLVMKLVALHAHVDGSPWSVEMYDPKSGWMPYGDATARYFASRIGDPALGRDGASLPAIRDKVDEALGMLPFGRPVIALIDPHAGPALSVWPGLRNDSAEQALLPGAAIRPDLAVVSITSGSDAVRATHRTHGAKNKTPGQPDLPGAHLYVHTENGAQMWLLSQTSRAYRGKNPNSGVGAKFTRWNLPERREAAQKSDWHLLTSIEIAVPKAGLGFSPEQLAILTARMCQQSVSWNDRTNYPAPLHLAIAADRDHPGFTADDGDED